LAREIAAKSTVLIKNYEAVLPLTVAEEIGGEGKCIAVFGDQTTISGGGSGHVSPPYIISPTQGIQTAITKLDSSITVKYCRGDDLKAASALASRCGTAVVIVATTSSEGSDRTTLSLGEAQDNLVYAVAGVNNRTIVAVTNPGAVLLPWASLESVKAILVRGFPGQENGNSLADVLFGIVNPYARLPVTMPNKDNEVLFTSEQYPGIGSPPDATYTEELLIGYRYHLKFY
jgi:beta-glucosidase